MQRLPTYKTVLLSTSGTGSNLSVVHNMNGVLARSEASVSSPLQSSGASGASTQEKPPLASEKKTRGGFFGSRPIRTKIALILVVPLLALLLFAGVRINDTRLRAQEAENLNALGKFSGSITQLVHRLSLERDGAVSLLTSHTTWEEAGLDDRVSGTDTALGNVRSEADTLPLEGKEELSGALNTALDSLTTLADLRTRIAEQRISTDDAVFRYGSVVENLLNIVDGVAQISSTPEVSAHMRALAVFSHYKEATSQESRILTTAVANGSFAPGQYRTFISTLAQQETYMQLFLTVAPQREIEVLNRELSHDNLTEITDLETTAARAEEAQNLGIDLDTWTKLSEQRADAVSTIEVHISESVGEATAELRDEAIQAALIEATLVLIALVVAITVSLLIARSMVRPLTRLRTSALEVANVKLPDAVKQLQEVDASPQAASEQRRVDEILAAALPAERSETVHNDEIGQTARAFDAVHAEAVQIATEQARLRRSVSGMFMNLARRSQLLVEKLISQIDSLEQGEEDPDRLSELFTLDHLANRMRRNDENLMILAGAEGGKRWDEDAPLVDVLRAATSEVEQYTRININYVDTVQVKASVVRDLAHLVAELAENAAGFSSPNTRVEMSARLIGDQVVIEIEDHGIGMSAEMLESMNQKLSEPPSIDVNISRMMGLFVVARLSHKQNIRVMLRSSAGGGVLAIVALPSSAVILPQQSQERSEVAEIPGPRNGFEHSGEHAPVTVGDDGAELSVAAEQVPHVPSPSAWRYNSTPDETTMETPLPIFDQIESEWFRPPTQHNEEFKPAPSEQSEVAGDTPVYEEEPEPTTELPPPKEGRNPTVDLTVVAENIRAREGTLPDPTPPSHEPADPAPLPSSAASTMTDTETTLPRRNWETPADAGWQRASELQEPATGSLTAAGLPKRVPQANYVPGSVGEGAQHSGKDAVARKPASHRSPDAVRGLLSSYKRGMDQGRAQAETATPNPVTDERATEEQ